MEPVQGHSRSLSPEAVALHERSALARWLSGVLAGQYETAGDTPPDVPNQDARTETERVRLFVNAAGGIPLPPYGSWWIDGKMMGPSSVELAEFYRQDGLRNTGGGGPVDFLPAELEFLHFLLQHRMAAVMTHQDDLANHARSRECEFLDRFLLPWIPRFCAKGQEVTTDRFWLAVFNLLNRFLESERQ